jgi:hypothetical protein
MAYATRNLLKDSWHKIKFCFTCFKIIELPYWKLLNAKTKKERQIIVSFQTSIKYIYFTN